MKTKVIELLIELLEPRFSVLHSMTDLSIETSRPDSFLFNIQALPFSPT